MVLAGRAVDKGDTRAAVHFCIYGGAATAAALPGPDDGL